MGFSKRQQPEYRAMVFAAWAEHCREENLPVSKKHDRDWYEQELFAATGQTSTSECNAGRDYDFAMAHFEMLARAGIRWQMKRLSGDANRILHELREVQADHRLTEAYLRAVAQRMLRLDEAPELHRLGRDQLIAILGEVKRDLRRKKKRAAEAAAPAEPALVDAPF